MTGLSSHLLFFLGCFTCMLCKPASAQHQGYIYGEVVLKNKQTYTGPIKWSGGQRLWSDVLSVTKSTNKNIFKYLDESQIKRLSNEEGGKKIDWQFMSLWEDKFPQRKNEILCRFGDIDFIHVTGSDQAQIYFKNGSKVRAVPYKNEAAQLGKNIVVYTGGDSKTIKWDDISTVKFRNTPTDPQLMHWAPLYGTVNTSNGPVTGFIQWNRYKYLNAHTLTGKTRNNEPVSYAFAYIARIEKQNNQVLVQLRSGKSIVLGGSDDVTSANKGIVVMHPLYGRVFVEWKAFRSLTLQAQPATGLAYENYPVPTRLYATVQTTDNSTYQGTCMFDLDEEWTVEMLDGNKDGLYYQIPFYYISRIAPYRQHYSKVWLKNNSTLLLGWANDVSDKNWGVIIWLSGKKYQYIPWNQVKEISFR
ncbi:MAG TPA: hypothetical protein VFS25_07800 [Chitinophaga sp.]|uniref:hypothetical protein n=1 Tax=Chitinophaga sp. TaxID=1869181 RepID=UPI002DBFE88C|nr:hypothetical protein [Chitinophaga sp.]HEU4552721.1 hypothetical protein [Chitinophaga sp.]